MDYVFDGSYGGFLSAVFESFERRESDVQLVRPEQWQRGFFQDYRQIHTDPTKAKRVQEGLNQLQDREAARDFYRVFLSEEDKAHQAAFRLICQVFRQGAGVLGNYGDADVLYFAQTLKKVNRERHRWKAFTRFQKSSDGLYFAIIEPDFNVLPLIAGFFKDRYADQQWLLYDIKRKYGIAYDRVGLTEVSMAEAEAVNLPETTMALTLDEREIHFQRLWQQYFKSTTIEARKNLKLHLRHVPKRYWKHLVEKQ